MPDIRRDEHSGALIFDLTPGEQEVKDLKDTTESLAQKIAELEAKLEKANNKSK